MYSPLGAYLGKTALPGMLYMGFVPPDAVYGGDRISSITSGATTWMSGNSPTGVGAISGSQVVFGSGNFLLAQPY